MSLFRKILFSLLALELWGMTAIWCYNRGRADGEWETLQSVAKISIEVKKRAEMLGVCVEKYLGLKQELDMLQERKGFEDSPPLDI